MSTIIHDSHGFLPIKKKNDSHGFKKEKKRKNRFTLSFQVSDWLNFNETGKCPRRIGGYIFLETTYMSCTKLPFTSLQLSWVTYVTD